MATPGVIIADSGSRLALFIESLVNEGRAVVSGTPAAGSNQAAAVLLRALDTRARGELAGEGPDYSPEAALWAATLTYQVCRFIVCRDAGEDQVRAAFAIACPEPRSPATDWSVDLMLRHLPALFRLARHMSNADPLVQEMKALAATWPLSSVGIPEIEAVGIDSFMRHPGLARLYADRIVAGVDASRLGAAPVDELLRSDLGGYPELAPGMAAKLLPNPEGVEAHAAERALAPRS